jgi:hypothetical protein
MIRCLVGFLKNHVFKTIVYSNMGVVSSGLLPTPICLDVQLLHTPTLITPTILHIYLSLLVLSINFSAPSSKTLALHTWLLELFLIYNSPYTL